jgi:hypothetical protein
MQCFFFIKISGNNKNLFSFSMRKQPKIIVYVIVEQTSE